MKLEIIMPHYDEPWSIVKPFFDMLCCQKGVDFDEFMVRLIHDGTEPFEDYLFSDMPFKLIQTRIEHAGVSAVRNYGLYLASAKWVCFCDCDDTFSSIYSLKFVFDVLDTDKYDLLWNSFYIENFANGEFVLSERRDFNLIWIHNKYYRLDFLKKVGAKFNEDLYFCEDSAFNAVINLDIDPARIGTIKSPMPLYVWCWRKNSATTNNDSKERNIIGHFERNCYVYSEFRKRNHEDADAMAVRTITDAYIYFNRTDYKCENEDLERRVYQFYVENKEAYAKVPLDVLGKVMSASEKEARQSGFLSDNRPPIDVWLKGLEEKYVRNMD